ncbi:MAG TPA: hypothetical protein VJ656_01075 [Pyrinomonadaceae bacterium]|nr:hypothetical protein [Pyrinomonadaceae bacterium]
MNATRLSAIDAFFVAYQETSGVLMQLGVEVELKGRITRDDLDRMLLCVVRRWPPLGQRLWQRLSGLLWEGECRVSEMVQTAGTVAEWRNQRLDPFREPPFQVLWIADGERHLLAFRAHHAVVDGEGFFAVCVEAVRTLANLLRVRRLDAALESDHETNTKAASSRCTPRSAPIGEALRNLQRLRDEVRVNKSASLAMRTCVPGDISIVERDLERNKAHGWLCASAWMKAIHAWNRSRGGDPSPLISLEVPVSLRRTRDTEVRIGNLISPLTLYGEATQPLDELAKDLKQQMSKAMRQRTHLALPSLASPAKFLPYPLFQKFAANPELTGSATSHFAWFEQSQSIHEDVARISAGELQIVNQQIYTPVCLHMGAAMAILTWPDRTQVFLTHRLSAFSTADAETLLDLMVQELDQKCVASRQVAV